MKEDINKDLEGKFNQSNQDTQEKKKDTYSFDELAMYFREPFKVNDWLTIYQPTIGDILKCGENNLWTLLSPFTCNPTSYRLPLWKIGIDWNKMSDYDLFIMLFNGIKEQDTQLIFGDFDFSTINQYVLDETNEVVFCNSNFDIVIDEKTYLLMANYIRTMFNQFPKVERAKGKSTKEAIIQEEIDKLNMKNKEPKSEGSFLLPLVSAMINHSGFKYKREELKGVGIVEFMDSVKRLQVYESTRALMSGMYSGMLDTSKMDLTTQLDWTRDLSKIN